MIDRPTLSVDELKLRGWTESQIKRFLGEADDWEPVNHWANFTGKRMYFLDRVESVEQSEVFEKALLQSMKRRKFTKSKIAAAREAQQSTAGLVEKWKDSMTPEALEQALALESAADIFKEARKRGYRTPHKC